MNSIYRGKKLIPSFRKPYPLSSLLQLRIMHPPHPLIQTSCQLVACPKELEDNGKVEGSNSFIVEDIGGS